MRSLQGLFKVFNIRAKTSAESIFLAIVDALPQKYKLSKEYTKSGKRFRFTDWEEYPGFRFLMCMLSEEVVKKYADTAVNKKITGVEVYSKARKEFIEIELIIQNNLISGLKVPNHNLTVLDPQQIRMNGLKEEEINAESNEHEKIYVSLPDVVKEKITPSEMMEIRIDQGIFYTVFDLQDGNYFLIDKNHNVYSFVHDATPQLKAMEIDLESLMIDLSGDKFNRAAHFKERHNSTKP